MPYSPGTNTGHGHVWVRPDGIKARCGGPGICKDCSSDAVAKTIALEKPRHLLMEMLHMLEVIRDADKDCHLDNAFDGRQTERTMSPGVRASLDAVIEKARAVING